MNRPNNGKNNLKIRIAVFYTAGVFTLSAFVLILVIGCLLSVGGTVTAFINPEYWALTQILEALNKK